MQERGTSDRRNNEPHHTSDTFASSRTKTVPPKPRPSNKKKKRRTLSPQDTFLATKDVEIGSVEGVQKLRVRTHKTARSEFDLDKVVEVTMKTADSKSWVGQRRLRVRSIDPETGIPRCEILR